MNFEEMGEAFLDYPLPADRVEAAFNDPLTDIDLYARKWFTKYYLPTLQSRETTWREMISDLRNNSEKRQAANKNFQLFVKAAKGEKASAEKRPFGANDIQLDEAVNIVKDMIYFHQLHEANAEALSTSAS